MKFSIHCFAALALIVSGCGCSNLPMNNQTEHNPWVIRTDFSDDAKWSKVCDLISAPHREVGMNFYAYVQFKAEKKFAGLGPQDLVHALPDDYPGYFCMVVDETSLQSDEFPILVIDFGPNSVNLEDYQRTPSQTPLEDIKTFRAIPSTIQSIENNLSLANMDFADFADSVDEDGVFRGFSR